MPKGREPLFFDSFIASFFRRLEVSKVEVFVAEVERFSIDDREIPERVVRQRPASDVLCAGRALRRLSYADAQRKSRTGRLFQWLRCRVYFSHSL